MADRVAVHRIVIGSGDERKVIQPGTRFNTDEIGIDAETLKKFDSSGVVRGPRDEALRAATTSGPRAEMAQGGVVEGRSGPVNDAVSPPPEELGAAGEEDEEEGEEPAPAPAPTRRRRSSSDEDL